MESPTNITNWSFFSSPLFCSYTTSYIILFFPFTSSKLLLSLSIGFKILFKFFSITEDFLTIFVLEMIISSILEELTKFLFLISSFKMNNSYKAECSYVSFIE